MLTLLRSLFNYEKSIHGEQGHSWAFDYSDGGISSIGVSEASDNPSEKKQSSAKKDGAKNYDEMVVIPAGKFIYGKPGSTKEITLPAYAIDKYEVTNKQFSRFNLDFKYGKGGDNYPQPWFLWLRPSTIAQRSTRGSPRNRNGKAARGTDGRIYPWETSSIRCFA